MWEYEQLSGHIISSKGEIYSGFAGNGDGLNNPAYQRVHNIGPLPCGKYTIEAPHDSPHTGPYTMNLTPDPANQMFGRSLFRIHGSRAINPELSSDGCIIQRRDVRMKIWSSGDIHLTVVSGL